MSGLKRLLRSGSTAFFAAVITIACSPAAASTKSDSAPLFVDEHGSGAAPLEEVITAPSEFDGGTQDVSTGDAPADVRSR